MKTLSKSFLAGVTLLVCGQGISNAIYAAVPTASCYYTISYDQALQILEAATPYFQDHYGITYADLVAGYDDATVTITQTEEGYYVKSGGVGTLLLMGNI